MTSTTLRRGLAAMAVAAALGITLAPASAANTPGRPGTPSEPTTIYTENFENGVDDTPSALTAYVGTTGMTYTADPEYDGINCNGVILNLNSVDGPHTGWGCSSKGQDVFPNLADMANALGSFAGGPADAAMNHAVSAYTHRGTEPADAKVFQTASPIPVTSENRFITFSVDGAVRTCEMEHPELKFYLLDGTTEIPAFGAPLDPCIGTHIGDGIRIGSFAGDQALLYTGSDIGILLRNGSTAGGTGNDFAFDNVTLLDVTPQLDTAFDAPAIEPGGTSILTFTVTNTSELAAKDGWSFDTPLPAGLTVTGPGSTDCAAGTVSAVAGSTSVAVEGGGIAAGVTSCTVTVPVTAADAGRYLLPATDTAITGLDAPADTELIVAPDAGAPMVSWQAGVGGAAVLALFGAGAAVLRRARRSGRVNA